MLQVFFSKKGENSLYKYIEDIIIFNRYDIDNDNNEKRMFFFKNNFKQQKISIISKLVKKNKGKK